MLSLDYGAALSAILTLVSPLIFLAPIAATDASNSSLLPKLLGVYELLALVFVVLVGIVFASMYLVRHNWQVEIKD